MPYPAPVLHLDFPELFKGAYVKMRNPLVMPWGEARDFHAAQPSELDEEARNMAFLASLIQDWNLPSIEKPDGAPVPLPISGEQLARMPAGVVARLINESEGASPNGETPSSPSSKPRSRGARKSPTRITSTGS